VTLAALEEALPHCRIIRAMPNAPLMVQAGMTALAQGSRATSEDMDLALGLFRAVGRAEVVAETHLDAVTALSGSGPAFVAVFMEALADGAVKMGLSRTLAMEFAAQTVFGTARLVLEKNLHPGMLKDLVASPGGTTIHGLHALEQGTFRGAVISAIEAATCRAQDLAATVKCCGGGFVGGGPGSGGSLPSPHTPLPTLWAKLPKPAGFATFPPIKGLGEGVRAPWPLALSPKTHAITRR
jgi:pyrroline-5-carboxylate reductase